MLGVRTSLYSQILNEREHSQNLVVNLDKMDLKKSKMTVRALYSLGSVQAAEAGTCEYGNEPSGFVK
jgi:hypothetical protein